MLTPAYPFYFTVLRKILRSRSEATVTSGFIPFAIYEETGQVDCGGHIYFQTLSDSIFNSA